MFGLAAGIYQSYFTPPQINILLIGEEGTGKSSLCERIKVTQTSSKINTARLKAIACPAPKRYNSSHMIQEEEPMENSSQRREDFLEQSTTNGGTSTSTNSLEDVPLTEQQAQQEESFEEYNLKKGARMLPLIKIRPTIGMNLARVDACGAKCHIWDLGGKMKQLWERYYADADAVIFCLTTLDTELLEHVRFDIPDDVPFLVFWHLVDKENQPSQPTLDDLLPHYHNNMMELVAGSAKTGQGVREALEWLVPLAKRQQQFRQQVR